MSVPPRRGGAARSVAKEASRLEEKARPRKPRADRQRIICLGDLQEPVEDGTAERLGKAQDEAWHRYATVKEHVVLPPA